MSKCFVFLIYFIGATVCSAQKFSSCIDSLDSKKYLLEVKQLDQFVKRFNDEENLITGQENTLLEIAAKRKNLITYQTERKKILLTLFNLKDSSFFSNSVVDFINFVGDDTNHVFISYYDAGWYATVNCSMTYKGKNKNVILTLENEGNKKQGFKWVIAAVKSDFINISVPQKDSTKFISPMNHELGFMDLYNVFLDSRNIPQYTQNSFSPDDLSIFLFLVKNGDIKYVKVESIKYHFLQVKNWRFTVDYFNRPDINSGWLISSLAKASDTEKLIYKKLTLSLK